MRFICKAGKGDLYNLIKNSFSIFLYCKIKFSSVLNLIKFSAEFNSIPVEEYYV